MATELAVVNHPHRFATPCWLDEGMKRCGIYFTVKRSKLIPMMTQFDWPDSLQGMGRRVPHLANRRPTAGKKTGAQQLAVADFCQAVFSLNEFIYAE